MIPLHVTVNGNAEDRASSTSRCWTWPPLTPQAVLVVLLSGAAAEQREHRETSYHLTGSIDMEGYPAAPLDLWAPGGRQPCRHR